MQSDVCTAGRRPGGASFPRKTRQAQALQQQREGWYCLHDYAIHRPTLARELYIPRGRRQGAKKKTEARPPASQPPGEPPPRTTLLKRGWNSSGAVGDALLAPGTDPRASRSVRRGTAAALPHSHQPPTRGEPAARATLCKRGWNSSGRVGSITLAHRRGEDGAGLIDVGRGAGRGRVGGTGRVRALSLLGYTTIRLKAKGYTYSSFQPLSRQG
jgi:hypothetical protein